MNENNKTIANALSLRTPQRESLDLLEQIVQKIDLKPDADLKEALAAIHEIAPKIEDFERKFPSVCFALATGVGKTRLMGAFIAYLHLEKGIKNFFVLAPNLTIYNKLIADFTPNTPKYVFPGIQEFAMNRPQVITGETYSQVGDLLDKTNQDRVKINIFNIKQVNFGFFWKIYYRLCYFFRFFIFFLSFFCFRHQICHQIYLQIHQIYH